MTFFLLSVSVAWASTWGEEAKLIPSDGTTNDWFGYSVAVDGDTAIVGTIRTQSAYIFTRSGTVWSQQAEILSPVADPNGFGNSVAIDGDTVVIGALTDDGDYGSAYIFTRSGTTWSQQAKLTANDSGYFERFGVSVAIDMDTVIIGAILDDDNGTDSGSAYVFTRSGTTWSQQAKLTASDGASNDEFGYSVAIYKDIAIVGSAYDDDNGTSSGSAYVFTRSGTLWSEEAKLVGSDTDIGDGFGYSVDIDGNTVIVGTPGGNTRGGIAAGAAYIFTRTGTAWSQQAKLFAPDGATQDFFGWSVGIDENTAVMSAFEDDDAGFASGSAYVFSRSGAIWTQQVKLTASDATGSDFFGESASISGDTILIGASNDSPLGSRSGSAYVFRLSTPTSVSIQQVSTHSHGLITQVSITYLFLFIGIGLLTVVIRHALLHTKN